MEHKTNIGQTLDTMMNQSGSEQFALDVQFATVVKLNQLGTPGISRMVKLQEEQGELAGAIDEVASIAETVSEAVDVLLMLLSIYADFRPDASDSEVAHLVSAAQPADTSVPRCDWDVEELYIKLCVQLGKLAESYQIHVGVKSSTYKQLGETTPVSILPVAVNLVMRLAVKMLVHNGQPLSQLQTTYNDKMSKWERVSK